MLGYDDKRAFFRMMMNSPCVLSVKGQGAGQRITAVCRDISATGMSFELDEQVEIGSEMEVAIESTSSQISSLSALVRVVRIIEETDGNLLVGAEVIKMM